MGDKMKKYFLSTFAAAALTLFMASCGNSPQGEQTALTSPAEQTVSETAEVTMAAEISGSETAEEVAEKVPNKEEEINSLETPIIFAACSFDGDYPKFQGKSLVLEMTEGTYDSENSFWNSAYKGSFRFRLTESRKPDYEILDGDIISYPTELAFNEPFDLSVDDYNNDGYPDFAFNQWNSLSGGTNCHLFTLSEYGKVKRINVTENGEQSDILWLPKTYRDICSPAFEKEGENLFGVSYFTSGGVSENELHLISVDIIDDWFSEHEGFDMSEFTLKNIYEWGDGFVVLKEQQILESDGSIWYSSNDFLWKYPHLTTLADYILGDLQKEPSFMSEDLIVIELTDFNNDGNTDAFISTAYMGINYCMIDNINAPKLIYNFFAFDKPDFLYDTKEGRLVIKYENHYGHFTNATSETNFIFAGDEITEISHVHFTGTSGPEEFYIIDEKGGKTVCGEADITASIAEIEKDLQPFNGDTERFRMTVEDDTLEIEKISD